MKLPKYVFLSVLVIEIVLSPLHAADKKQKQDVVEMSGISIIGNRELPKTLFIVPWKNSEVGVETELTNTLNEGMQPLDREVFGREVDYFYFTRGK